MFQKLLKCAVFGGIVASFWGMIAWNALPWKDLNVHRFKNESRVVDVIRDNAPDSGIYLLPNRVQLKEHTPEMASARESEREGPFMFSAIRLDGRDPNELSIAWKSWLLKIVAAFIVAWLAMQTKLNFRGKVGFITLTGVLISMMGTLPYWIWFGFPFSFAIFYMFKGIVGWFLAGLVIAKLMK